MGCCKSQPELETQISEKPPSTPRSKKSLSKEMPMEAVNLGSEEKTPSHEDSGTKKTLSVPVTEEPESKPEEIEEQQEEEEVVEEEEEEVEEELVAEEVGTVEQKPESTPQISQDTVEHGVGTYQLGKNDWICNALVSEDHYIRSAILTYYGIKSSKMTPQQLGQAFAKAGAPIPKEMRRQYTREQHRENKIFKILENRLGISCKIGSINQDDIPDPSRIIGFRGVSLDLVEGAMLCFMKSVKNEMNIKTSGDLPCHLMRKDITLEECMPKFDCDGAVYRCMRAMRCAHMSDNRNRVSYGGTHIGAPKYGSTVRQECFLEPSGCKDKKIKGTMLSMMTVYD